jgi:hypothetical protein
MINLIPPTAKRAVRHEYRLRVLVVYLWLVVIGGVIVGTLLVSPLAFIHFQTQVVADDYTEAAGQQAASAELVATIDKDNERLQELSLYVGAEPLMPLVEELEEIAGTNITITAIRIVRDENGAIPEVVVVGTAATRQVLATFEQNLESRSRFGDIVLPLANLARDQDLPFQLTIPLSTAP